MAEILTDIMLKYSKDDAEWDTIVTCQRGFELS
jgi:hypothetical protein